MAIEEVPGMPVWLGRHPVPLRSSVCVTARGSLIGKSSMKPLNMLSSKKVRKTSSAAEVPIGAATCTESEGVSDRAVTAQM